ISAAPVLATARLILRPFRGDDVDAQAAMMGDPAVMAPMGAGPLSREDAWRKLLCGQGMWGIAGYGYWAVEPRADRVMIGQIGCADFKRGMAPNVENIPEMGWLFASQASGQGYATEAGVAALAWADATLGKCEIVAIIDAGNAPSIRVAEKLGF